MCFSALWRCPTFCVVFTKISWRAQHVFLRLSVVIIKIVSQALTDAGCECMFRVINLINISSSINVDVTAANQSVCQKHAAGVTPSPSAILFLSTNVVYLQVIF